MATVVFDHNNVVQDGYNWSVTGNGKIVSKFPIAISTIRGKIPRYSEITDIIMSGTAEQTTPSDTSNLSTTKIGIYLSREDSDGNTLYNFSGDVTMAGKEPETTEKDFSRNLFGKDDGELKNGFTIQSKNASAGQASSKDYKNAGIRIEVGNANQKITAKNIKTTYTVNYPSISLRATGDGQGTFSQTSSEIEISTQFKTTAIPTRSDGNNNRFVQWIYQEDSNPTGDQSLKNKTSVNKTITFTHKNLTAFNTIITAEFTPIYKVSINQDGGIGGTTDFWYDKFGLWNDTDGSTPGKITLKNPIKTGYTFLGWSGTGINGYSTNVEIPVGSTGDRTYKANWQINQYTVTLQSSPSDAAIVKAKLKDGTEFTNSMLLDYNTQFALISATNQNTDKYVFEKFSRTNKTDLAGGSILTSEAVPSWNITYTAHYNLRKYSISAKSVLITKDEDGRETETQEDCAIFELNGSSSFDDQEYGKIIYISFLPKFGYKFVKWKGVELSKANNSVLETQVYSDIYATACFEKINPIENSLPDNIETLPIEEKNNLIKSIANSIVNKTIINYINTVQMSEIGDYAFYKCENLKFVNIPNITMSALGKYSFCGCKNLTSIRIPENITRINSNAFANCINLTTLILPRTSSIVEMESIDTLLNTPFNQSLYQKKFGYIYVPKDLIGEYQTGPNWCTFAEHFRTIEDYPEVCGG